MQSFRKITAPCAAAAFFVAVLVAGCGGGGGDPGKCAASEETCAAAAQQTQGQTQNSPPATSDAYAGMCTLEGEKQFTRAYLNEVYLWYSEMPQLNASLFNNVPDYFYSLLTPKRDATGQYKDRFSFIVTDAEADSLLTGAFVGYGIHWVIDDQGRGRITYVDPGSPAEQAQLARGGELVGVGANGSGFYPTVNGSVTFDYRPAPGAASRTVTLQAASVQEDPVPNKLALVTTGGRHVAYFLFNGFTQGAQDRLIDAVKFAQSTGSNELVLDMRYNGGGYLSTAVTLASMISGPSADGQVAERLQFNDKRAALSAQEVFRFSGQVQYGETVYATGTALPRMNLPRVYLLTTGNTCSASETVINSLRGIGVEVDVIGGTTCGKPYGFSQKQNCGFSYFPIEFQGVNAKGFGDYASGFQPTCAMPDDLDHPLGSPTEGLLAAAMYHIDNGTCPAVARSAKMSTPAPQMSSEPQRIPGKLTLRPK
jgi:carboxyl-terminal processing protease